MSLDWALKATQTLEAAIRRFPVESGMCAPLARAVLAVAKPVDAEAKGLQVKPSRAARYILPRHPRVSVWYSHTLVSTRHHHVDALTGVPGCEATDYLQTHFAHPEALSLIDVDVDTVDPGAQNAQK